MENTQELPVDAIEEGTEVVDANDTPEVIAEDEAAIAAKLEEIVDEVEAEFEKAAA